MADSPDTPPLESSPTIPAGPAEHPALDYARLRREGIQHLEGLIGHLWTDFNTHDPGITILEQLCYALTDLGYRAAHPIPDLLASGGGDPYGSLFRAPEILTTRPVTLLDLRKLVIDVVGVKNAWIEPVAEPRPALYFDADRGELGFRADPPYTTQVSVRGLLRVLIETSDLVDRPIPEVRQDVVRRLAASRPLCADFAEIRVLASQPVRVHAEIEIGLVDDAERVLVAIYLALAEHISPTVPFRTLGEALAAGQRSDEIFDGPALEHGFLDSAALARMGRRDELHASDLIREIAGIPGVVAVRSIALSVSGSAREPWVLELDPDRAPRLDLDASEIVLVRGRLTAALEPGRVRGEVAARLRAAGARGALAPADRDFVWPAGRDRSVARYRSIQHDLPALYGVGAAGLPASAPARRRAQAKQLNAYLLIFDQLLATSFAQLAGAGALLSFGGADPRTYFTQLVDGEGLGLDAVRGDDAAAHLARLEELAARADAAGSASSRKNRFLNHLLARFAEQLADYSMVRADAGGGGERLVPDKQAFLQRYPRISAARGTGLDALAGAGADADAAPGLAERLARKLGLAEADGERLLVIEHVLLAPIVEDDLPPGPLEYRQIPLLAAAAARDPYSLQLSVVLPGDRGRFAPVDGAVSEHRLLAEHAAREETPAHLTPFVHWLDEAEWAAVERAYEEWRAAYREHRAARLGLAPVDGDRRAARPALTLTLALAPGLGLVTDPRGFRVRDARDRLVDLLRLGETYPLRDLPVDDDRLTVPFNQPARIPVGYSQRGVRYELRDPDADADGDGEPDVLDAVDGTGGTIFLQTPPMKEDATFLVMARKLATGRRAYLQRQATVKVGLDVTLPARIVEAALLDPALDHPADDDARVVSWGARAIVQIDRAQEGVDYHLVQIAGGQELRLSPDVRGDLGDIRLVAEAATEDVLLRVRATKVFDPSEHRPTQAALLDAVMPLAVRARVDRTVAVEPAALVAWDGAAAVRIDASQASAAYSVYARAVPDRDYRRAARPGLLAADVDGAPRVYVARPPSGELWQELAGFQRVGAPVAGTGGAVRLPLAGLRQDCVILVRAEKQHAARPGGGAALSSAVQLAQAALVLVRPDPRPALAVAVVMDGGHTDGDLSLTGGQPGVYYELRREVSGAPLGPPAYFHKADERDPTSNKGVARKDDPVYGLEVEVDFAISRGPQRAATTPAELAATPPLPPLVPTGPIDAGTTLYVRAIKAQTRAAVQLAATAQLAAAPVIAADPAVIPAGAAARIVVRASAAGERYQLARDGQPIGPARDGDGSDLALAAGALAETTRFEVIVTRPGDAGLRVQRTVLVVVTVAPPA